MIDFRPLSDDHPEEREAKHVHHVFKTPLWRSTLKLDTDDMLRPVSVQ